MIIELVTVILIEIVIVLEMYIISWVCSLIFYEEEEPPMMYSAELSPEKMEELKQLFEEKKDD